MHGGPGKDERVPSGQLPAEQTRTTRVPPSLLADVDQVLRDHGVDAQPWAILRCLAWLLDTTPADHQRDLQ
jgi:hypothetical protein